MPIRMERDEEERSESSGSGGSGGGNPLLAFLPFILMFLFKNPRLAIALLVVAGGIYYFTGGDFSRFGQASDNRSKKDPFSFGCSMSEAVYDQAEVFEPLSMAYGTALPAQVSLLEHAPRRLNQGRQGSCVGWSSAYAARTILHAKATGANPDELNFSPSFLYNQIALEGCQGSYLQDAMETMKNVGVLPFSYFAYDESSCDQKPTRDEKAAASDYTITGFNRLCLGGSNYKVDMDAIKQNLAQGAPVVIGMQVGGTFMQNMFGKEVWKPTERDYNGYGFSGHAMCVIGYDDNKAGGAFQIMNSWGTQWGENGIAWVAYKDFEHFVKEAYGLYPVPSAADAAKLQVRFGLVRNDNNTTIPLVQTTDVSFKTTAPIRIGDKFKIAITNTVECYIYVLGEETGGSSYVLFPYKEPNETVSKYSPYCGITGTRLFPKDHSMIADAVGNRDRVAIVVSKEPLDYNALNDAVNSSKRNTFASKVKDALGRSLLTDVDFTAGKTIDFKTEIKDPSATVLCIVEIDKQ